MLTPKAQKEAGLVHNGMAVSVPDAGPARADRFAALAVASLGLGDAPVEAVVVVPTFRRPAMLMETLRSLEAQTTARRFAVLVVENDAAAQAGLAASAPVFSGGALRGGVLVERDQGNVHAINAGFTAGLTLFPEASSLLMIDDDEVASPGWLEAMLAGADKSGADIVGGPVVSRFAAPPPAALLAHPVFLPGHAATGPVPMVYGSGNCLIRRRVFLSLGLPPFDTRYNFLGGGDLDFFLRCRLAGFRAHWVQEALITETVPPERMRTAWVLRRSLRIGTINRVAEARNAKGAAGRLKVALKDLAHLPLGLWRGAATLARTREPLVAAHPLLVSVGRMAPWFGLEPQPYKAGNTT